MGHHKYIWQQASWPNFSWNSEELLLPLAEARKAQGKILSQAELIGIESQAAFITDEAFSTSAIEGEKLDRNSIRSSVARRLGLPTAGLPPEQRHIDGLVEMLLDATRNFDKQLDSQRIKGWQASLFPTGYSGIEKIQVGNWRIGSEPMRVISGPMGAEVVHFEAPPSKQVPSEVEAFLIWWNAKPKNLDGLIRAAIAHFWFVTIHPFDDGNGRVSRAITDMALSQDEQTSQRLYSLSTQIIKDRNEYYSVLENSQKGKTDITEWLVWFLKMFARAVRASEISIKRAVQIAKFWQYNSSVAINDRQRKVIQKMLEAEPQGFEGGINNRKYVSITGTSRESAKRDLADLESKKILIRNESGGRSVNFRLNNREVSD